MRRAKVAVARKLAVVMHRVWKDDCDFNWGDAPGCSRMTHIRPIHGLDRVPPDLGGSTSQPGRGPATSRPSLRLLRDDGVRDIEERTSPMPCCGGQQTAERTMTWQDSSPQPDQASHRAHGHQGPALAALAMLAAEGRLRVAPRGSARLRASLDGRSARRSVIVQAGTEKRRSNRTEKRQWQ